MMENLRFSITAVSPLFLLMFLGYALKKWDLISGGFAASGNKLVFYLFLPVTFMRSVARTEVSDLLDGAFIAYTVSITVITFFIIWAIAAVFIKDRPVLGAFAQGAFRGNMAFVGMPLLIALMGDAGAVRAALIVAFVLPVANVLSILVLAATGDSGNKVSVGSVALSVAKNPLVIGIMIGLVLAVVPWQLPAVPNRTLNYIADMATPLALLCLGAGIRYEGWDARFKYALVASLLKVAVLPVVFVGLGFLLGFGGYDLVAFMVMGGVPGAIAGYAMVVQMGGDSYVGATIVVLSTLFSAVTLTIGIYILRIMGVF